MWTKLNVKMSKIKFLKLVFLLRNTFSHANAAKLFMLKYLSSKIFEVLWNIIDIVFLDVALFLIKKGKSIR